MRIAVIPGDGIGKEVTAEAVKVLHAVCAASGKTLDLQPSAVERRPLPGDRRDAAGRRLPDAARRLRRPSSSARSAIRACPTTGTRATSCSAPASSSTSTSTTVRCGCSTTGSARSRAAAAPTSTSWCSARTPRASTSASAGASRRAPTDEVAIQEEINTRKGVERIIRDAFEYAQRTRPDQGVHGRQEQRHAARARAVAARVQGGGRRVSRRSPPRTSTSTRWPCSWSRIPGSSR